VDPSHRLSPQSANRVATVPESVTVNDVGLPVPALREPLGEPQIICFVSVLDSSGRIADRSPIRALGWAPGQRIEVRAVDGVVEVRASGVGTGLIAKNGRLRIPVAVRRLVRLTVGDRVLILVNRGGDALFGYTMDAVATLIRPGLDGRRE
jgi:bifunctional DNA-binding transcriptional regulator/antitoxin component of YhaV-PrlF toxin-antitoxin module